MAALIETRDRGLSVMYDIIRVDRETDKAICFALKGQRKKWGEEIAVWLPKSALKKDGDCYHFKGWFSPKDESTLTKLRNASYFMMA